MCLTVADLPDFFNKCKYYHLFTLFDLFTCSGELDMMKKANLKTIRAVCLSPGFVFVVHRNHILSFLQQHNVT